MEEMALEMVEALWRAKPAAEAPNTFKANQRRQCRVYIADTITQAVLEERKRNIEAVCILCYDEQELIKGCVGGGDPWVKPMPWRHRMRDTKRPVLCHADSIFREAARIREAAAK